MYKKFFVMGSREFAGLWWFCGGLGMSDSMSPKFALLDSRRNLLLPFAASMLFSKVVSPRAQWSLASFSHLIQPRILAYLRGGLCTPRVTKELAFTTSLQCIRIGNNSHGFMVHDSQWSRIPSWPRSHVGDLEANGGSMLWGALVPLHRPPRGVSG